MFPMRNPTAVSPETVSSFPVAVFSFCVTGLSFETDAVFFHVFSLNTLILAPVSSKLMIHKSSNIDP